jgi:hypothetical protein
MRDALADRRSNKDALAARIRTLFGGDALKTGAKPKATTIPEGLVVAWAIEAPGLKKDEAPQVITDDPAVPSVKLQRVGKTDVFASTVLQPRGMAGRWRYEVGGETRATGQYEDYPLGAARSSKGPAGTGGYTSPLRLRRTNPSL